MQRCLFYSKNCASSMNIIQIIQNQGLMQAFRLFCVDDMTDEQVSQSGLTAVPTIIIYGQNNQRQVFEGKRAFDWLQSLMINRQQWMMKVEENRRNILKHNAMINNGGPQGFIQTEMSGLSDDYAYLAMDMAQPKQYMMKGQDENYSIITLKGKDTKLGEREQKDLVNQYQRNRDIQSDQLAKIVEQQIINCVYDAEANK